MTNNTNTSTSDLFLQALVSAISNTVGDAFTETIIKEHSADIDSTEKPAARIAQVLFDWTTRDFGASFTESVARSAYVATLSASPSEQKEILSLIPEHLLKEERAKAADAGE